MSQRSINYPKTFAHTARHNTLTWFIMIRLQNTINYLNTFVHTARHNTLSCVMPIMSQRSINYPNTFAHTARHNTLSWFITIRLKHSINYPNTFAHTARHNTLKLYYLKLYYHLCGGATICADGAYLHCHLVQVLRATIRPLHVYCLGCVLASNYLHYKLN